MAHRLLVALVLLACSVFAQKLGGDEMKQNPCLAGDTVQLISRVINSTCNTVEGVVEVCEEGEWKKLCDSNWTVEDAAVTCRSLNYSAQNAQNKKSTQISPSASVYELRCDGSENSITDCDKTMENTATECSTVNLVLCHLTEAASCEPSVSVSTTTATLSPSPSTADSTNTREPTTFNGPSTPTLPASTSTSTMDTAPRTSLAEAEANQSTGFFAAPTLYYFIGALCVIILTASVLIAVCLCACFCCRKRRKDVSPLGQQEKGTEELRGVSNPVESTDTKDHVAAQYQLQQQPIYEAIANESSSTHSQESPSMQPLEAVSTELYATLDQNNTYAELEPHISSPRSASISSPNADAYYQQLDHRTGSRTGSMKREFSKRPIQAMNPTAVAMDRGEVQERDLAEQGSIFVEGSSTSLPANAGRPVHPQHAPNGSVNRYSHLEQVNLKETQPASDQSNIYNILDPPPDYSTLEQIDEVSQVSTTAVCNNRVARGRSGSISNEHSPQSSRHSQERLTEHVRSSTLPSSGRSPRTSRTSSSSSYNSPHTNRSPHTTNHRIGNKYSDDPTGSPRILTTKRYSGQLEAKDTMV